MLTVPATNIATLMVIKNELGKHELGLYLLAIISSALVSGLIVYQLQKYCCSSYLRPVQYKLRRPEAKHLCLKQ